jgi:hypothetical protein
MQREGNEATRPFISGPSPLTAGVRRWPNAFHFESDLGHDAPDIRLAVGGKTRGRGASRGDGPMAIVIIRGGW